MSEIKAKISIKDRFKNFIHGFLDIFKDYPVALIAVILLALCGSILIDYDRDIDIWAIRIPAEFLCIFSVGALFSEQLFRVKKNIKFIISIAISIIISVFYTCQFEMDKVWFFGLEEDVAEQYLVCILSVIIIAETMITIFSMYRSSKTSFEKYCINTFAELFKTTVIYVAFAIGIALIIAIFNILIFDTDEFIERIEIFLVGGVFTPMIIKALSKTVVEPTKFAKVMVQFVFMPMLLLAYVIIYIYMIKILFSFSIPKNEVFTIIAFLFSFGMPIWTMSQSFEDTAIGKIAKKLPFIFIPMMILQMICIGIRIADYGLTSERYEAVALIVFEMVYLILYIVKTIKKNEAVSYAFLAVPIIAFIILLMPAVNIFSAVTMSQAKIFEELYKDGDIKESDKSQAFSAYREITYAGYQGDKYLKEHFTKAELKEIGSWSGYSYYNTYVKHYYFSNYLYEYDVAGYSKLYKGCMYNEYGDSANDDYIDLSEITVSRKDVEIILDFDNFAYAAIKYYDAADDGYNYYLQENPYFDQGDYRVYVSNMSIDYEEDSGIVKFDVTCDVLVK